MAAGILAYFALSHEPPLALAILVTLATALAAIRLRHHPRARLPTLTTAFAAAGFTLATLATSLTPPFTPLPRHAATITGQIATLDILPEGRRVTLSRPSLDGAPPRPRTLRIRLRRTDATPLAPGDTIAVRALLRAPSPPDYPGGWDTQRDAFFANLDGYGFAISPAERLHAAPTTAWSALRAATAQRILEGLPGPRGAIAATLLTGSGTAIPPDDRIAFQNAGLAHLLAVAGLHIGIVMATAFAATRALLALSERAALHAPLRQIAAVAALAAGAFYLALTGAHLPIIRSFAMAALVTLGVLTGRRAFSLRGLAIAALILMTLSPASVVGVSFQMSFASVLVLITGYQLARPLLARLSTGAWWQRPALHVTGLALTSLLAGTASLPFAAYHFGTTTLYYVPANMAAVPLTAFWIMPWGLAALALMPFHLERLALIPMGWGIALLRAIAHTVSAWPAAIVGTAQMPAWALCCIAAGLVWLCLTGTPRRRAAGLAPIAAGLFLPMLATPPTILVTPHATIIAIHIAHQTFERATAQATLFDRQAPLRVWATPIAGDLSQAPGATCTATACRLATSTTAGALITTAPADTDCATYLVITAARSPCPHAIDHTTIADGPAEAWLTTPPRLLTDHDIRGTRPWVLTSLPKLPFAQTE